MRKIACFMLIFSLSLSLFSITKDTRKKLKKYSGENYREFIKFYEESKGDKKEYAGFILNNISKSDCSSLTAEYLKNNIDYAIKTKELEYSKLYDDNIFKHFVLPYRASQEPLENWRKEFYDILLPKVKDIKNIQEAAIIVNLWVAEQMTFKQTHGRDQSSITTINRGFGRCEESMILYILAARAVGIPARPASIPYWNFSESNHAWVEIWTPKGWKYIGEAKNRLNDTWFTKPTTRATVIMAEAFGKYENEPLLKFKENTSYVNSTKNYTKTEMCTVKVKYKNKLVKDADVTLYATTFGGLSPIINLKTDKNGKIKVFLGKSSVYVVASQKGKVGSKVLDTVSGMNDIVIDIKKIDVLEDNFNMMFSKTGDDKSEEKVFLENKFDLLRDNANLKLKNRIAQNKNFNKFLKIIDEVYPNTKEDKKYREKFIEQALQLNNLALDYIKVYESLKDFEDKIIFVQMIINWDVKELCEPVSKKIIGKYLDNYKNAQNFVTVNDTLFFNNIIRPTWRSFTYPAYDADSVLVKLIMPQITNNLEKTKNNIIEIIDKVTKVDKDFSYTYFSGSLTSSQVINMKNISESLRFQLLNQALIYSGIPTRWKGQLEYYNGEKFLPLEKAKTESEIVKEYSCSIQLKQDENIIKPEAWSNFRIMQLYKGDLTNVYFEGECENNIFNAKINTNKEENLMIVAFVRNKNGDANVVIKPIVIDNLNSINLLTPQEFKQKSFINSLNLEKIENLKKINSNSKNRYALYFIGGKNILEPEKRMLVKLKDKLSSLDLKETKVLFLSENMAVSSRKYSYFPKMKNYFGEECDYPIVLLFDKEEIILNSEGLNLEIIDRIFSVIK